MSEATPTPELDKSTLLKRLNHQRLKSPHNPHAMAIWINQSNWLSDAHHPAIPSISATICIIIFYRLINQITCWLQQARSSCGYHVPRPH
jgi:hypothetical protein